MTTLQDRLKICSFVESSVIRPDGSSYTTTTADEAQSLIYADLLAIIGEDFNNWGELDTYDQHLESIKNDLRKEIRKSIRLYCGVK